jgi:hypothetical protein
VWAALRGGEPEASGAGLVLCPTSGGGRTLWHYRTCVCIVFDVDLTWKARGGDRSTFDGRDATGRHYGYATNISGK